MMVYQIGPNGQRSGIGMVNSFISKQNPGMVVLVGMDYDDWDPDPSQWLPGEYEVQIFNGNFFKVSGRFTITGIPPTTKPTVTPSFTPSNTPLPTNTRTPTLTRTIKPTQTPVPTRTATITRTPTSTRTPTITKTPTPLPGG